jgi:excisionase family DNA binding protein
MLNRKELASKLRVSERTIHRWTEERLIPYYLLNGIKRYDEAEIDQWLKTKKVRTKPIQ